MTDPTSITVRGEVPASAERVFEVLTDPSRHAEIDGSGFVRGLVHGDRLARVGQTFRMDMADDGGGEYQTDNVVTGFDEARVVAWQTAPAGTEPPGWEWGWELRPRTPETTEVTLTYDWSQVTDPQVRSTIAFPLVDERRLEDSLARLAALLEGAGRPR